MIKRLMIICAVLAITATVYAHPPGGYSSAGNVVGPSSGTATDNAIARWDGVTGKLLQDSAVTIDDSGNITLNSGGDIILTNNSGKIVAENNAGLTLGPSNSAWVYQTAKTTGGPAHNFTTFGAKTNTSGASPYMQLMPVYNQTSGTASNTDLLINRTETAVGSGAQLIIDAQVDTTSMNSMNTSGAWAGSYAGIAISNAAATTDVVLTGGDVFDPVATPDMYAMPERGGNFADGTGGVIGTVEIGSTGDGDYRTSLTGTFEGTTADIYKCAVFKEGSRTVIEFEHNTSGNNVHVSGADTEILTLVSGDTLDIRCATEGAGADQIDIHDLSLSVSRVGQ